MPFQCQSTNEECNENDIRKRGSEIYNLKWNILQNYPQFIFRNHFPCDVIHISKKLYYALVNIVYLVMFIVCCVAFFLNGDWLMQRGQTPMFAREIIYTPYFYLQNATTWVLSMNFHQRHASPWLTGWPSTRIRSCCVLSAFIINKSINNGA